MPANLPRYLRQLPASYQPAQPRASPFPDPALPTPDSQSPPLDACPAYLGSHEVVYAYLLVAPVIDLERTALLLADLRSKRGDRMRSTVRSDSQSVSCVTSMHHAFHQPETGHGGVPDARTAALAQ